MTASTKQNITINQGATYSMEIALYNTSNNALNVTNYTAASQLRKSYESLNAFSFSTSLSNGMLTLSMTSNTTSSMWPGRYQFDVFLYYIDGTANKIMEGIAEVIPQITTNT